MPDAQRIDFGLSLDQGQPSQPLAVIRLGARFSIPVEAHILKGLVSDTFRLATEGSLPDDSLNREKGWLFFLVRRLKRHFPPNKRKDMGRALSPLALVFFEVLGHHGLFPDGLDNTNADEVQLAFEAEWETVQFAEGEDVVSEALEAAKKRPCVAFDGTLALVISLGFHLQERNGGKEFYLPVSEGVAARLGICKRQLGTCVKVAIGRGFFREVRSCIPNQKARVFRFDRGTSEFIDPFKK